MDIDKRLTEINIIKLIDDIGIPFKEITDEDINAYIKRYY